MTRSILSFLFIMTIFSTLPRQGNAGNCLTAGCHLPMQNFQHGPTPVSNEDCSFCHKQILQPHPDPQKQNFSLNFDKSQICQQCHPQSGYAPRQHPPEDLASCLSCHDPHQPLQPNSSAMEETSPCYQCHDPFEAPYLHGPVAVEACSACHTPHDGTNAAFLKKPSRDLCLGCHESMAQGLKQASHLHTPVREQPCTSCHDPHGANQPYMLAEKMPDICHSCHEDIANRSQKARVKHPALFTGNRCGNCHSTHYSNAPGLLSGTQQDLCFNCHGKNDFSKSDALRNIADDIEDKKYLHGPLNAGECSSCHDPHGTDNFRMLKANYPESFYAPFQEDTYQFCLECHDKNLLRFPETSIYTRFRNGKQNLHYTHTAITNKGRTCRACHAPHASNTAKLMSGTGASFGDWAIPIRFQITDSGGSCTPGCHRSFTYDRENPADYKEAKTANK